jgi:(p)ppGpp synthase/HD superfamily hydrolase
MTERLERALRWAAERHSGHTRKGGEIPYVEHPFGVALILDRCGFDEDVVIAGLLHDVVEDTPTTIADVRDQFGADVGAIVALCTERKVDGQGKKRPWLDRKTEYIEVLRRASLPAAFAVALADKLHNLVSIKCDLRDGEDLWSRFNADRDQALWYYRTAIDTFGTDDPKLSHLARECRQALTEVETLNATVHG